MSAQMERVTLPVEGMSCAACVAKVEKALKNTSGVQDAKVNLVAGKATVDYLKGARHRYWRRLHYSYHQHPMA